MADSLVDIGNGFKVVNPQTFVKDSTDNNGLKAIESVLQIKKLQGDLEQAPLDYNTKLLNFAKSQNDVQMLGINNELLRSQLINSINSEQRQQRQSFVDNIGKSIDLIKENPELGVQVLQTIIPGSSVTKTSNDSWNLEYGQGNQKQSFPIYTGKITDPKVKVDVENRERDQFVSRNQNFNDISVAYKTMIGLAKDGTGASDMGLIYQIMKVWDPRSVVREGEFAIAQQTGSVPNNIVSLYNQAVSGQKLTPEIRQQLIDAAKSKFQTTLSQTLEDGRNVTYLAQKRGLNPEGVISPMGGLRYDDFKDGSLLQRPNDQLTNEELLLKQKRLKELYGQ